MDNYGFTHPFPGLQTPDPRSQIQFRFQVQVRMDSVRAASSCWNLWGKLFALPPYISISLGSNFGALRVNCTSRAVSLSLFLKEIIFKRNNLLRRRLRGYQNECG